jgi:hypothetical protein
MTFRAQAFTINLSIDAAVVRPRSGLEPQAWDSSYHPDSADSNPVVLPVPNGYWEG